MAVKGEFSFLDETHPFTDKRHIKGESRRSAERVRELVRPGPEQFKGLVAGGRAAFTPQFRSALLPGLTASLGRQQRMRGGAVPLSADIGGAVENVALSRSFDVAGELSGLRSIASQLLENRAEGPSSGETRRDILGGAAAGFATGGPFGAIAGGVGGALSSKKKKKAARKENQERERRAREIAEAASPEKVAENVEALRATTREVALASGAGARREAQIESAVSLSGLRGTGLGSIASIAAGAQEDLASIGLAFDTAIDTTKRIVGNIAGREIPTDRSGDRITQALEGLAQGVLAFGAARGKTGTTLPTSEPLVGTQVGSKVVA